MSNYDYKKHLEQLHAERKANTHKKVDEAIKRLIKVNKAINFNSVSQEAVLTKATLCNNISIIRHCNNSKK